MEAKGAAHTRRCSVPASLTTATCTTAGCMYKGYIMIGAHTVNDGIAAADVAPLV
jgi:hypothetical protein